jgi:hypothetical protein
VTHFDVKRSSAGPIGILDEIYYIMNHNYNVLGEIVGKAFEDGKQMK